MERSRLATKAELLVFWSTLYYLEQFKNLCSSLSKIPDFAGEVGDLEGALELAHGSSQGFCINTFEQINP